MRRLQAVNVKAHKAEMLTKHCNIDQLVCRLLTDPETAHTSGKYRGISHSSSVQAYTTSLTTTGLLKCQTTWVGQGSHPTITLLWQ